MKRYYFSASVKSVYGSQTYYADAESEESALAIVNRGEGTFDSEDLEVQDLYEFELEFSKALPNRADATGR